MRFHGFMMSFQYLSIGPLTLVGFVKFYQKKYKLFEICSINISCMGKYMPYFGLWFDAKLKLISQMQVYSSLNFKGRRTLSDKRYRLGCFESFQLIFSY